MVGLLVAQKAPQVVAAQAVWVGIGALPTAVIVIVAFKDPVDMGDHWLHRADHRRDGRPAVERRPLITTKQPMNTNIPRQQRGVDRRDALMAAAVKVLSVQ